MFGRRARGAWLGSLAIPGLLLSTLASAAASSGPATATPLARTFSDCGPPLTLDRGDFPNSPRVTNRYLPYTPGMQYVLDGVVLDDQNQPHPHQIITTVTDLTKVVDGVRTLVIQDVDVQDGEITESEIFFVAQDHDGNVWTLGEDPEEYDGDTLLGAPSAWLSGVQDAHAGIAMPAKPKEGGRVYLQGIAPEVDFKDCASVFKTGEKHVCVPVACYDKVLETDEFAPLDPAGGHQRKLNAPGIGVVKVGAAGGVDPETLTLISARRLCKADFSDIRQQALDQDVRGYTVAPGVYAGSAPAKDTIDTQLAKSC